MPCCLHRRAVTTRRSTNHSIRRLQGWTAHEDFPWRGFTTTETTSLTMAFSFSPLLLDVEFFRNYMSIVQSMHGTSKRRKEKKQRTQDRNELLHIAFMVFITFDLFYTDFFFSFLAGVTGAIGMRNAVLIPPFLTSYLFISGWLIDELALFDQLLAFFFSFHFGQLRGAVPGKSCNLQLHQYAKARSH
jgi:hypothetical protein